MPNDTSIEARLCELERRHGRLQVWCAATTAALACALLTAAVSSPDAVVSARRFALVGDDGRELGALESRAGEPCLQLDSADGSAHVLLGVEREATVTYRVTLRIPDDGTSGPEDEVERNGPPAPILRLWTGAEDAPDSHLAAGAGTGGAALELARGDDGWALLSAGDEESALRLEEGDETCSGAMLIANAESAWAVVGWELEARALLFASRDEAAVEVEHDPTLDDAWQDEHQDEPDPPPAARITVREHAGELVLRDADGAAHRSP